MNIRCMNPKCQDLIIVQESQITDRWESDIEGMPGTTFWSVPCRNCGAEYRVIQKMAVKPAHEPTQPNLAPPSQQG